jgi:hypothetical protein
VNEPLTTEPLKSALVELPCNIVQYRVVFTVIFVVVSCKVVLEFSKTVPEFVLRLTYVGAKAATGQVEEFRN